jgi:hypothetical protein
MITSITERGFPKTFFQVPPGSRGERILVLSDWRPFKMTVDDEPRTYNRAVACIFTGMTLRTWTIGPMLIRQFQELPTWRRWVWVTRDGERAQTRYRLQVDDKLVPADVLQAAAQVDQVDWIPLEDWPPVKHLIKPV